MIVTIEDWVFNVDIGATMEYSAREAAEHCTCAYCRNFYTAVDSHYPQLRPFLAQFGVDIEAPDRMSPVDYDSYRIDYDPMYYIFGEILQPGKYEMSAGIANIVATPENGLLEGKPYFRLDIYEVSMPWVLAEPFEGGVKPIPERTGLFRKLFRRKDIDIPQ